MKTKKNKILQLFNLDNAFLIVCLTLFSVFLIKTFQMKHVSAFLLPRILCISGIVFIIIMIISSHFKKVDRVADKVEQEKGIHPGFAMSFAGGYFFITYFLGFILSTCIAIIAFSYMMKFQNKKIVFILSVMIPFTLHFAFVTFLQATLPRGIIENLLF